eukprot:7938927-Lingulodinium_polyedra.AAC.1
MVALEEAQKHLQDAQLRKDELKYKFKQAEEDSAEVLRKFAEEEKEEAAGEDEAFLAKAESQVASGPAHGDLLQEFRA